MAAPALTLAEVRKLDPCTDDYTEARNLLKGYGRRKITWRMAKDAGVSFDSLVWVASAAALENADINRRLRLWMADCAARVLHLYEKTAPDDPRVRDAIVASRQFARGEIDAAAWDAASRAASRAASAASGAAWDAARDAARDAAWDAARDAAWAAARDAEEAWQFDRLILRMSHPEPADWPLPTATTSTRAA